MITRGRKSFEDFVEGDRIALRPYLVSELEIIEFARKYDPQAYHVDPQLAKDSVFQGLVSSGWMTTAIFMRMQCDSFLLDSSCLGSPGVDQVRWLLPVRPGDELAGEAEITARRPSQSKPDRGVVHFNCRLWNQNEELVMTLQTLALFARREHS